MASWSPPRSMPTPISDNRRMSRDILLLLGLPALLIAGIGYATWPWASPRYSAPSQEAFFETATGVWDRNSEGSCIDDPYFISFSDDRALMFVVMREPWKVKDGDSVRLAIYDLSEK